MLNFVNLKLCRKFLILTAMIVGLCVFSFTTSANNIICCSVCEENYNACVEACYNPIPEKWEGCIEHDCDIPFYLNCFNHCSNDPILCP
jgi:hypothetical protein